jgi:hypothetical protein
MLIGADFTGEGTNTGLSKVLKGIFIRTINYIYLPNPICITRRRIFMLLPIKSRLCNVLYIYKREGTFLEKVEVMVKDGCQRKKSPNYQYLHLCVYQRMEAERGGRMYDCGCAKEELVSCVHSTFDKDDLHVVTSVR